MIRNTNPVPTSPSRSIRNPRKSINHLRSTRDRTKPSRCRQTPLRLNRHRHRRRPARGQYVDCYWSKISGPGAVTFSNPNNAVTTAQFSAVGSYVLRLSASDGAYLASADVGVILTVTETRRQPRMPAPNQTILLSQGAQLNGSVSDDGLPAGSSFDKPPGPKSAARARSRLAILT